jgi:hypothetical protein
MRHAMRVDELQQVGQPELIDHVQRAHRAFAVPPGGGQAVEASDFCSDGTHPSIPQ